MFVTKEYIYLIYKNIIRGLSFAIWKTNIYRVQLKSNENDLIDQML